MFNPHVPSPPLRFNREVCGEFTVLGDVIVTAAPSGCHMLPDSQMICAFQLKYWNDPQLTSAKCHEWRHAFILALQTRLDKTAQCWEWLESVSTIYCNLLINVYCWSLLSIVLVVCDWCGIPRNSTILQWKYVTSPGRQHGDSFLKISQNFRQSPIYDYTKFTLQNQSVSYL